MMNNPEGLKSSHSSVSLVIGSLWTQYWKNSRWTHFARSIYKGRLKEWTYVALGIDFISAGIALYTIMGVVGFAFPLVCLT